MTRQSSRITQRRPASLNLREAWEKNAPGFIAWARKPMHDSYWRFHREQFLELVPSPGRLTLDIGCGEGRLSRDLKARGHTVIGIDGSSTMVAHAREADPSIEVYLADAAALPVEEGVADLAVAFMSLQDVDDLRGAVTEAARVLQSGGRFCIAIVHPINSAGAFADREADSAFVIPGSYLEHFYYEDIVEREGIICKFASEHRPLETYADALSAAGFLIERLREPSIPENAAESSDRVWQRIPRFLHIRAVLA